MMTVEWDWTVLDHVVTFTQRIEGVPYKIEFLSAGRTYEELAKLAIKEIERRREKADAS